jgi:hypothetical protein
MKRFHLPFCLLSAALALTGGTAHAGAIVEGDPADGGVLKTSVNSGYYNTWLVQAVGQQLFTDVGNIVEPFTLPYLPPGQTVTGATISFYLDSTTSPVTSNVQLYGLNRVSTATPTVTTADWYSGTNDTANTLLCPTFATPANTAKSTVTYSGGNLVNFIQKQYANSAFSGQDLSTTRYVYFRLSPDRSGGNVSNDYEFGTARNSIRLYHPTLSLTISSGLSNVAGRLQFAFVLPQASITSAGVYNASTGTLIRTIWNNQQFNSGMNYGAWDGKDDSGNAVATGTSYQIKMIYHNVQYVWDGTVGNTSTNESGACVYRGYLAMSDMSIAGGRAYYAQGYNELQNSFHYFTVGTPQVANQIQPGYADPFSAFEFVAADATRSYWAKCGGGIGGADTYVIALNNSDGSNYTFPKGTTPTGANQKYTSCLDFDSTANQVNPPTGLAVQQTGSDIFVSHANLNVVRVFDKVQGNQLGSFTVTAPGRMATTANGDVWVISNAAPPVISRYTFANGKATLVRTITGLVAPVGAGISADDSLLLVTDAGSSEQIKAFNNSTGASTWTFGQAGGMQAHGPAINTNTFDFSVGGMGAFVAFQADNTFWVNDTGNDRYLHYSINGTTINYIEQIAFLPHSYQQAVDVTDPTRAYNMYFEYSVNYNLPIAGTNGSWTLAKNWLYGLPNDATHNYVGFRSGINNVATLPNGHVYAFMENYATSRTDLFELPATGPARLTGYSFDAVPRMYPDGSLRFSIATTASLSFYSSPLTGFDSSNNPKWGTPALLASTAIAAGDPTTWTTFPERTEITSGGMVVDYDPNQAHTGYHMGGIPTGGSAWQWRSAPSTTTSYTGWFPRDGHFDIGNGVQYAGNESLAMGRNVVCGYHGEFWKNGEASQWLNYFDNGLLVGVFGSFSQDMNGQNSIYGYCGNSYAPDLVRAPNGKVYLYMNDESNHGGSGRWIISGWEGVTELKGTSTIGSTVSLSGSGAPTVSITAPTPNAVYDISPSISVTADAAGSGAPVTSVQFFDGSTSLGTVTSAPYTVITRALTPGVHTLTATATDSSGRSATSPSVAITIGNGATSTPPPAPASLNVTGTTSSSITLGWTQPLTSTTSSTIGQILSFQCDSATNSQALSPTTVAGAPGYAVSNWNILGQVKSNGLILTSPVSSAGVKIANLGINTDVRGGNPGGSITSLPGSAQQLFSNEVYTTYNTYPAITVEYIPYAQYDLVVYSLDDSSSSATAKITVNDIVKSSVITQSFTKAPTAYNVSTVSYGSNASVTDVNTIVFQGLTSSTIEIQGNYLAAFQIVERPYDQGTPTSYSIERATGSGSFAAIGTTSGSTTSYTDTTAVSGTTYQYRVRAINSVGSSGYSNTLSATTSSSSSSASSGSSSSSTGSSSSGSTSGSSSGSSSGASSGSGSSSGSSSSTTPKAPTTPAATGFAAWQARYFTPAQLADSSISGPSADPYGSSVPNLLAYALQLNPATARPTVTSNTAGTGGTNITVQDTLPTSSQKHFMRLRVSQN